MTSIKVLSALGGAAALTLSLVGCGNAVTTTVSTPVHVTHHALSVKPSAAPKASPSVRASVSTSADTASSPYNFSSYPASVKAGVPTSAQPFDFSVGPNTNPADTPPPPTGGLAGAKGQATAWSFGLGGAIILFINPANAIDSWDVAYAWVPAAKAWDVSLDVVDVAPVVSVASVGTPPTSPNSAILEGYGGAAATHQSLTQMAATMAQARTAWHLPAWVNCYEVSPDTARAWHVTPNSPTAWIFRPDMDAGMQPPSMAANIPDASMNPAQAMQAAREIFQR